MACYKSATSILGKDSNGNDAWFSDGELNSSNLPLDYHIEQGRGDQAAFICDSSVTNSSASYKYGELRDEVATVAGAFDSLGVSKRGRVILYMPTIPQAVRYARVEVLFIK